MKNEDEIISVNPDQSGEETLMTGSAGGVSGADTSELPSGGSAKDFTVNRLVFSKQGILLEKGVLTGHELQFSKTHQAELPFAFNAVVWKSPEALQNILTFIHDEIAQYIKENPLLSIIIPEEWATLREVFVPDNLPEEAKEGHILWTFSITGWEDGEYPRFGYEPMGAGIYNVVYVRDSILKFAETVSKALEAKLVQLSVSALPDLNLLLTENPEKNSQISIKRKSSILPVLSILLIIIIIGAGYYLWIHQKPPAQYYFYVQNYLQGKPAAVPVKAHEQKKEASVKADSTVVSAADSMKVSAVDTTLKSEVKAPVPVDSVKTDAVKATETKPVTPPPAVEKKSEPKTPAVKTQTAQTSTPLANMFMLLHKNVDIYHLSFTGETVRCKFTSGSDKADALLKEMNSVGTLKSAEIQFSGVENGKNTTIITGAFLDKVIGAYSFPEISVIKNALKEAGFKPDGQNYKYDTFTGNSEKTASLLKVIDNNRILIYRIRISQTSPNNYVITLEY